MMLLFLSHAGADTQAALRLAERIEAAPAAREHGLKAWIDKRDLAAGRGWQSQLEHVIERRSTAFAVYVGTSGIVNWVDSEIRVALSRTVTDANYPFIPIISADADERALPAFARQYQGVKDIENKPGELEKLLRAALRLEKDAPTPPLVSRPFLGLRSFDEQHTQLFYGRAAETAEIVDRLMRTNLLMIVADSGSGKSSLAKAGLIPKFRGGAFRDSSRDGPDDVSWHVVQMRPLRHPFDRLVDAVSDAARAIGIDIQTRSAIADWIRTRQPDKISDALREGAPRDARVLLLVDQFEELWTQTSEKDRASFIDVLTGLTERNDLSCRVVLTMRHDYYNLCSQYPRLFQRLENPAGCEKYLLRRMNDASLRECITAPLALAGYKSTDALADAVLKDVGDRAGDLALLEVALTETWRRRSEFGGDLLEAYERVGRVAGALSNAAEDIFTQKLSEPEQRWARATFLRLVRLGETGGTTRRIATRDEFSDEGWELAQRLAQEDHRRLIFIRDDKAEIAHEALVTQWPRYQTWLQEVASMKRLLDPLIDNAKKWARADKAAKKNLLARGSELRAALALLNDPGWRPYVSSTETNFIKASRKAAETARFATVANVAALVAFSVLAILTLGFSTVADSARIQAVTTNTKYLARDAQSVAAANNGGLGLMLALEALPNADRNDTSRPLTSEALSALSQSMLMLRERRVFRGHEGPVRTAAFSPDGTRIVTASDDETPRVWGAASGVVQSGLYGHGSGVLSAAFSPNGTQIVTVSKDKTARVWDSATGKQLFELRGVQDASVPFVAFSPDNTRIVAAFNNNASIWDAHKGEKVSDLKGHTAALRSAAFSPDGDQIITASDDRTARVWNTATGKEDESKRRRHPDHVRSVAFSPDGKQIVTASDDRIARVWNVDGGPPVVVLTGHQHNVRFAAFSPTDGARIITGSDDKTVRVWEKSSGREIFTLRGHDDLIRTATFSADGKRIVTASDDGTARIWDATAGKLLAVLRGHNGPVLTAEFSKDGRQVVTASDDGTARVWEVSPENQRILLGHLNNVRSVAFSPDGRWVVTASDDKSAGLWDAVSGEEVTPKLEGHADWVRSAVFSQDGSVILTTSNDGTALVWDSATHQPVSAPMVHDAAVVAAAFNPGNRAQIVTGSEDRIVRIWDWEKSQVIARFSAHTDVLRSVAFSPDGRQIITASDDDTAGLWDVKQRKIILWFWHGANVRSAAFSPDGKWIVTASDDRTTRVWDTVNFKEVSRLIGHQDIVRTAAFSPDSNWIVTASDDKTARVWDRSTGQVISILRGHDAQVFSAAFSPNGKWIATGAADGTARMVDIGPRCMDLIRVAEDLEEKSGFELTAKQLEDYGLRDGDDVNNATIPVVGWLVRSFNSLVYRPPTVPCYQPVSP